MGGIIVKYSMPFLKMFLDKLIILCYLFYVHADVRDYTAELAAETDHSQGCYFLLSQLHKPRAVYARPVRLNGHSNYQIGPNQGGIAVIGVRDFGSLQHTVTMAPG